MKSQDKLRIAIAGGGVLVQQVHLPVLKTMARVEVVGIADPLAAACRLAAEQIPGLLAFETLSKLLDEVECDGVIVASPTHLHAEQACLVLSRKRALYLEKPMASTLNEANQVIQISKTSNAVAMMGFNYRFNPLWQYVAQQAKSQTLTGIDSVFSLATRELPVWKHKRSSGGGALLDLASHHLDLMFSLFELRPLSIEAQIRSQRTEHDCVKIQMISDTGIAVNGSYSLMGEEADEIRLRTASGLSRFSRYEPFSYPLLPPHKFVRYHLERWGSPWKESSFARSIDAWICAIEENRPSPIPLADGYRVMQWIDAAESSAT
jgi:myo-inositol 2-dehydrogenase/D-chiro-inositol 1-dehydrogenase